jgi:hypothetical protein
MAERQLDPAVVPPFLAAFIVQWKMCLHNLLTALLFAAVLRQLGRALHHFSVSRTRMRYPLYLGGANLWNAKAGVIVRFSLCSCSSCVSPAASTSHKASSAPPARHTRSRQPRRQHVTQGGANIPVKPLRTGTAQILVSDLKVTLRMRCCGRCHIKE